MDGLLEFLFGIFFEVPAEATMKSRTVKTWVKTALWSFFMGLINLFVVLLALNVWFEQKDPYRSLVIFAVALILLVFTVFAAIFGHKRKWKQDI